ncbi:MAG: GGDEF domain-containing protein, partial [Clostridiales bacterium]|nr:GGDEF domain-containing protein [Clostridiales bacterium]
TKMWSLGIVTSHFILLIFMIVFLLLTRKLKSNKEPSKIMHILQYIVVIVIMASGIAIVTIDQLVTSNITPFLLICIVCGAVFLIRPLISIAIFASSYTSFYFLLALTISDQEALLSNRANGATAVGIGLLLSLIMWNSNYTNISQKRRIEIQQEQLERMAYYDPLTDLPNRRLFDKLIKQEISSMQRYGHESIIIILDIDDFKKVNDTYGHMVGDKILIQLGNLLKSNVRVSDAVSRFGGEEYIILMPKTSLESGYDFGERLRKLVSEEKFIIGSDTLRITCSFGVSLLRDKSSQNLDSYYLLADKALYLAKQNGKDRVEIASDNVMIEV